MPGTATARGNPGVAGGRGGHRAEIWVQMWPQLGPALLHPRDLVWRESQSNLLQSPQRTLEPNRHSGSPIQSAVGCTASFQQGFGVEPGGAGMRGSPPLQPLALRPWFFPQPLPGPQGRGDPTHGSVPVPVPQRPGPAGGDRKLGNAQPHFDTRQVTPVTTCGHHAAASNTEASGTGQGSPCRQVPRGATSPVGGMQERAKLSKPPSPVPAHPCPSPPGLTHPIQKESPHRHRAPCGCPVRGRTSHH